MDCGVKNNIIRMLCQKGAEVTLVPWNYDLAANAHKVMTSTRFMGPIREWGKSCPSPREPRRNGRRFCQTSVFKQSLPRA